MKKLNNGVVPPVPTFHFERIRIAKEGNNHHEIEYMARGGDRRRSPLRPCGTCGADAEFASTGLFRVNAQKKRLDVWLIYRCATCGSVWNSAVISRGRPGSIDREELERFTGNDPVMALWCALDVGLLRRNGARRGKVAFVVEGDRPAGGEDCRVEIDGGDLAGLRLAEVLRAKLGVSRSGLERLVEAGDVSAADGADVLAAKLRPHQTILVRGRREQ